MNAEVMLIALSNIKSYTADGLIMLVIKVKIRGSSVMTTFTDAAASINVSSPKSDKH